MLSTTQAQFCTAVSLTVAVSSHLFLGACWQSSAWGKAVAMENCAFMQLEQNTGEPVCE